MQRVLLRWREWATLLQLAVDQLGRMTQQQANWSAPRDWPATTRRQVSPACPQRLRVRTTMQIQIPHSPATRGWQATIVQLRASFFPNYSTNLPPHCPPMLGPTLMEEGFHGWISSHNLVPQQQGSRDPRKRCRYRWVPSEPPTAQLRYKAAPCGTSFWRVCRNLAKTLLLPTMQEGQFSLACNGAWEAVAHSATTLFDQWE